VPLTESIRFKAKLERRGQFLIPRVFRWFYKMEPGELLRVEVELHDVGARAELFMAQMSSDGRVTVPRLNLQVLEQLEDKSLVGCLLDVTMWPVHRQGEVSGTPKTEEGVSDRVKRLREGLGQGSP